MKTLTTLLLLGVCFVAYTQEPLNLTNPHFHAYSIEELPDELYRFPTDQVIQDLIDTVLARTNNDRTFTAYAANVPAVTAVQTDQGAYLLYNQVYLNYQIDENSRLALLAQGIGHLVQGHRLTPERRASEVLAADVFVGFSLFRMGVPEPFLSVIPVFMAQKNTPLWRDRHAALEEGFQRSKYAVLTQPGSGYQGGNQGNLVPGFPEFPFPPPNPSASDPLTDYFVRDLDFADIDRRLRNALEANGYYEHRYFYVKNGFVLITAMEQFNHPEGTSKEDPGRWSKRPVRQENFSLFEYLGALFKENPAYYRLFVFVVTDQSLNPTTDKEVSLATANKWLSHGSVSLPPIIGEEIKTQHHEVHALVYELIKHEGDNEVEKVERSQLPGRVHLQRSGIMDNIKQRSSN